MKSKLLGLMVVIASLGLSPARGSTYSVDFSIPKSAVTPDEAVVVTGTIVTDCDSCTLGPSDFTSWSFTVTGTMNGTFSGGPLTVSTYFAGTSPLSANAGVITYSPNASGALEFLFVTGGAENDELIAGIGELVAEVDCLGCEAYTTPPSNLQFATETVSSATPLPAALPLFGAGLGLMGLLARRGKRNSAGAIATA